MKRFFAIVVCLVLCTSASNGATAPQQAQTRASGSGRTAAITAAFRAIRFLIGLVPNGDGFIPPIPKPEGKSTTCCK